MYLYLYIYFHPHIPAVLVILMSNSSLPELCLMTDGIA